MNRELFQTSELMQFQAQTAQAVKDARKVPMLVFKMVLHGVVLAVTVLLEWEIVYQVFDYLAGEAGGYWQPGLMALSASSMIVGFHLLAKLEPDGPLVRFVRRAVRILIPAYMVGIGLLVASILYGDGLGGMADNAQPVVFGQLAQAVQPGWLDQVFNHIASPAAVLALSIGLGGLAVINIFVAHELIARLSRNGAEAFGRALHARMALRDHATVKRCQMEYAELAGALEALEEFNDAALRRMIAVDVVAGIAEALLPHKAWLVERSLSKPSRFEAEDDVDHKSVAKRIEQLESIRLEDVLAALNPTDQEKP